MVDEEKKDGQVSDDDLDDFGFSEEGFDESETSFEPLDTGEFTDEAGDYGSDDLLSELEMEGGSADTSMSGDGGSGEKVEQAINWAKENMMYLIIGAVIVLPVLWTFLGSSSSEQLQAPPAAQAASADADDTAVTTAKADDIKPESDADSKQMAATDKTDMKSGDSKKSSLTDFFGKSKNKDKSADEQVAAKDDHKTGKGEQDADSKYLSGHKATGKQVNDLDNRLTNLEKHMDSLTKMQDMLGQMSASLKKSEQTASNNDKNIEKMQSTVLELTKAINNVQKSLYRSTLLEKENKDPAQKEDFVVQATIAGRAWLRNQDGVLITVREGQEIPGYGKVRKIDPTKGHVVMSTKLVFKEEE